MRIKLVKRRVQESDGPGFTKATYLYEKVGEPEFKICESFIERVFDVQLRVGDIIEVDAFLVRPRELLCTFESSDLLSELSCRLEGK